jgi:hypothetical protein
MFVVPALSGDYGLGVPGNLNLSQYSSFSLEEWNRASEQDNLTSALTLLNKIISDGNVLFYGFHSVENTQLHQIFKDVPHKALLNLWAPCEYVNQGSSLKHDALEQTDFFDTVYSICPYTNKWLKECHGDEKHKYIFHPFVGDYAPTNFDKKADVCYFGGIHSQDHADFLGVMKKFDYRLMTLQNTLYCDEKDITHLAVPINDKMDLIAGTKASVCYNMLPLTQEHILYIKQYEQWEQNEAFSHLDLNIAPQYKCRVAEAAFCKSVILMKRDPWNIVEHYFTPGEDFIYWDTLEDLEEKIRDISENFENYQDMIESAYKKSLAYTSKPLFDIIKSGKEWTPNV